jgi:hypothetical protein
MKITHFFILMLLFGCQKEDKKNKTDSSTIAQKPEAVILHAKKIEAKTLKTDTVLLSEDKSGLVDYILANLIEQKADKDSIVTSKFRLDFYQNKNKIASSKIFIKQYEKGSEWSGSFGLTAHSDKNSSFIKINCGYPACGYTFENYLYYLKNNNLQLVHQWQSMSDGGWGSWTEFLSEESKDPEIFYCKTVAFEPADDDSEDSGVLSYSDSTSFSLKGNRWQKKLLTAKDKAYFEKKMSLTDFYKQD